MMESHELIPAKTSSETLIPKKDELPFSQLSRGKIWEGVKLIANATFSTSLSLLCVYMINMISLAYISNLRDAAMIGGIGLGFVFSNCCAYILITSVDQGVNALAAQAFGAKRYSFVALSYHRGLFLQVLAIIPVLILLGFTKEFLVFFNIEESIAQHAWDYIKYAYPSIFFYGVFDATKSFLFAQRIFTPILVIQFIAMLLHIFWGWLFIAHFEMGPAGAGLAKNVFELFNMAALLFYINKSGCCKDTWVPFSDINWREVMEWDGVRKFMSFTIPIAAILFLDMACYEVFSILAGQFDEDQLAVHVAVANSATLYYSLPLGLSIAIMTYVSQSMGAGQINAAKNHTYCGMIVDVIITCIFVLLIWICEDQWAGIFSANESIKKLLHEILNIYLLMVFFDGIQVALSGTLKGIGKQNAATIGMVVSYYFVALPLIYFFAFTLEMQVVGIWVGFLVGIIALLGLYLVVLHKTNFPAQAKLLALNFGTDIEMRPMVLH